jgi:hypothetical protein
VADEGRIVRAFEALLDQVVRSGTTKVATTEESVVTRNVLGVTGLTVVLADIQDVVPQQMRLFPLDDKAHEQQGEQRLHEVQRYLTRRFGVSAGDHLRRAVLAQPGAPLPEWRVAWQGGTVG